MRNNRQPWKKENHMKGQDGWTDGPLQFQNDATSRQISTEEETKPREKGLILFPAASPFPPFSPSPVYTLGRSNPFQTNYITRGLLQCCIVQLKETKIEC